MRRLSAAVILSLLVIGCGTGSPAELSSADGTATQHAINVGTMDAVGTRQAPSVPERTPRPNITSVPTRTPTWAPVDAQTYNFPEVSLPFIDDGGALPENALMRIGIGYIITHAVSPDGMLIAVGTSTGIYVYSTTDFSRAWRRYTGYPVGFVAWSPDGTKLTTGEDASFNGFAEPAVWDAQTGVKVADLKGAWYGATWSPDSTLIAALSYPGDGPSQLMIFDSTGQNLLSSSLPDTHYLSRALWSPDGTTIAIADTRQILIATPDILLWDVKSNSLRTRIRNDMLFTATNLLFSPDGFYVTSSYSTGDQDASVWASTTGQVAFTLPLGDDFNAKAMAWSHNGAEIARLNENHLVISRVPSGETERDLPATGSALAWSADDLRFAVSDTGRLSIVNAVSGAAEQTLGLPITEQHVTDVPEFGWLPDGLGVSFSTREVAGIWDLRGELVRGFSTFDDTPGIRWSPDSAALALRAGEKDFQVWDIASGQPLPTSKYPFDPGAAFDTRPPETSPDGALNVAVSAGKSCSGGSVVWTLKVVDNQSQAVIYQAEYTGKSPTAFAWSPNGDRLAIGFGSADLPGADTSTIEVISMAAGTELATLVAHTASIHALAFSPDGAMLASSSADATVIVWNAAP